MSRIELYCLILGLNFAIGQDQDQMNSPTGQEHMGSQENRLLLPTGTFCFFTCNELMFEPRMQEVVPTARRLGAGMLLEHQIVFRGNDMSYSQSSSQDSFMHENIWGALYAVSEQHFSLIENYVLRQDPVALISAVQVETTDYQMAQCLAIDLGLRPNSYPFTSPITKKNGSPDMPTCDDFGKELHECGAPEEYYEQLQNIPIMQQMCSASPKSPNNYNTASYPPNMQSSSPFSSSRGSGTSCYKEMNPQLGLGPFPYSSSSDKSPYNINGYPTDQSYSPDKGNSPAASSLNGPFGMPQDNGMNFPYSPSPLGNTTPPSLSPNSYGGSSMGNPLTLPYGPDMLGVNNPAKMSPGSPYSPVSGTLPHNTNGYPPNQGYSPDIGNLPVASSPNGPIGMSQDNEMNLPYSPSPLGNTTPPSLSPNSYGGSSMGNPPASPYGPEMLGGNNPADMSPASPYFSGSNKSPYSTNGYPPDQSYSPEKGNSPVASSPNGPFGMPQDNGMNLPYSPSPLANTTPPSLSPNSYGGSSMGNPPVSTHGPEMLDGNNPADMSPASPYFSGSNKSPYSTNGYPQDQSYSPDTGNSPVASSPNGPIGMSQDNGMNLPYSPSPLGSNTPPRLSPNSYGGPYMGNPPASTHGPEMLGDNNPADMSPASPYFSGSNKSPYSTNGYPPDQSYSPEKGDSPVASSPNGPFGMPQDNGMNLPYSPSPLANTTPPSLSHNSYGGSSMGNPLISPYGPDMLGGNNLAKMSSGSPHSSVSGTLPHNTSGYPPNQGYSLDIGNSSLVSSPNGPNGMFQDNVMNLPYSPSPLGSNTPRSLSPNSYGGTSGESDINPANMYPPSSSSGYLGKPPCSTSGYSPNQGYSPDTDISSPFYSSNGPFGMPSENGMNLPYGSSHLGGASPQNLLSPPSSSNSPHYGEKYPKSSVPSNLPYGSSSPDGSPEQELVDVLPTGMNNNFAPVENPNSYGSQMASYGPKKSPSLSSDGSPSGTIGGSYINNNNNCPQLPGADSMPSTNVNLDALYTPQFTSSGPKSKCDSNNSAAGFGIAAQDSEFCSVTPKNYKPSLSNYDSNNLLTPPSPSLDYSQNRFGSSQMTPTPNSDFPKNNFRPLQTASPSTAGYSQDDYGSLRPTSDTEGQGNQGSPSDSEIMISESSFQNVQYSETRTEQN